MIIAQMFRVFTDAYGNCGDKASIVIDEGRHISDKKRQAIARKLNTGETIFINNIKNAEISVMHPQGEISFAGVGGLGTAWFLTKLHGKSVEKLIGRDGDIVIIQEENIIWVRVSVEKLPQWNIKRVDKVSDVESIKLEETSDMKHMIVWSWIDEAKGFIRARTFATDWEIPEAQGNGSGAMLLATILRRSIEVKHGEGSVIFARLVQNNGVEVGGRVIQEADILVSKKFIREEL